MEESILVTIKKLCNIELEDDAFDSELIVYINTAIASLRQIGIGPSDGYSITGYSEKWSNYIEDMSMLESAKTCIGLKVRMIFDPPTSSMVCDAINNTIKELEWRLNLTYEKGAAEDGV